jgi:hypothetical protein
MKTYCSISHCYTGKDVTVLPVVGVPFGYVKYRFVKSGDENIEPE